MVYLGFGSPEYLYCLLHILFLRVLFDLVYFISVFGLWISIRTRTFFLLVSFCGYSIISSSSSVSSVGKQHGKLRSGKALRITCSGTFSGPGVPFWETVFFYSQCFSLGIPQLFLLRLFHPVFLSSYFYLFSGVRYGAAPLAGVPFRETAALATKSSRSTFLV